MSCMDFTFNLNVLTLWLSEEKSIFMGESTVESQDKWKNEEFEEMEQAYWM